MLKKLFSKKIGDAVNKLAYDKQNTLQEMQNSAFPVIFVPFNGRIMAVKVRCLNLTQIKACGDFSCISLEDDEKQTLSFEDQIKIKNTQEKLIQETLYSPSFDEINEMYFSDNGIRKKKEKLKELKKKLEKVKTAPEGRELEKQIEAMELYLGFLLPDDFVAAIVTWALGLERSDIRKINRTMLLEAAITAKLGHNNPADHLEGDFTSFHKEDINKRAWLLYNELMEQKKLEQKVVKGKKVDWLLKPKKDA